MIKERFKLIPAVYLIIKKDNEILLSLRENTGYMDDFYGLVSGHVDGNEPARFACIREAKEEADINISISDLKIGCVMHRLTEERECIDMFFILEDYKGNIENMESDKCGGLDYFNINDLPKNLIPYIKLGIENSLNGVVYCECGFENAR